MSRLPENLARAAVDRGLRVSVFVHEPWVPPSRFPWLVLSPIQRRQLLRLVAVCHATVTAVPAWCELLGDAVHLVYVGSTLGDPGDVDAVPPLLAPVVFSPFAAGLNWDWIRAAINAIGTKPGTIVVGADAKAARIHPQIKRWFDPSWDWLGRLPAEEVLSLLGRAPLVLAPFIDGLTARRTSAMAAMSVGTRVISSSGHLLDPIFENSPAAIAPDEKRFVEDAVRNWEATDTPRGHEVRRRWYEARLSATKLDLELLRIVTGDAAS